jgi:hypothetical protein
MMRLFGLLVKEEKVEDVGEKEEIIKVLNFTQVMEEVLRMSEVKGKVEGISVKVNLLTKLPSTLNLTLMPPQGYFFKNQFYLNQRTNFCSRKFYCCEYYWQ